ncbi:MAG: tetratricopeptide repeat protein [Candidatus Sedimenticola sp. (ex Thyasira tokunagai)]
MKNRAGVNPNQLLHEGMQLFQMGQFAAAERRFSAILAAYPKNSDALHLQGLVYDRMGDARRAMQLIRKAIKILPKSGVYHRNYGILLSRQGKERDAIQAFKNAIRFDPNDAYSPNDLGVIYDRLGRLEEAVASFNQAIEKDGKNFMAYNNRGNTLQKMGDMEGAVASLNRAIAINAEYPEAYNSLGVVLQQQEKFEEALSAFEKALQYDPKYESAKQNALNVKRELRHLDEFVLPGMDIESCPQTVEALWSLAQIYIEKDDAVRARECLESAAEIDPLDVKVSHDLSLLMKHLGDLAGLIDLKRKLFEFTPDDPNRLIDLCYHFLLVADWSELKKFQRKLDKLILKLEKSKGDQAIPVFQLKAFFDNPQAEFAAARVLTEMHTKGLALTDSTQFEFSDRKQKKSLRVGYLSADFRNHPVAYLMLGVLKNHHKERVEVYCYSYGPDDASHIRGQIRDLCDNFVDVVNIDDAAVADRIYNDEIDILVDLQGNTRGARRRICARHPAPVQAEYLGYPGTTGADYMDYIITDHTVSPMEHAAFYSEKLAYLPNSYLPFDEHNQVNAEGVMRSDFGLPEDGVVFCSFNQTFKIEPIMFECWMNLLKAVDGSVLWLPAKTDLAINNLRSEAEKSGVDGGRIVRAERVESAEDHLARLSLADLALDTRLYNGHTTTMDALWSGVPVVAMRGNGFASRVSASLLNTIGLPELVADDLRGYEEIARELALNPTRLTELKQKLALCRTGSPLFDMDGFTRDLEALYDKMWKRHVSGNMPDHIVLD